MQMGSKELRKRKRDKVENKRSRV